MNYARKPNRCERDVESERIPHVLSSEERRSKLKTATLIICVAFVSALFLKRDCYLYRECQMILQRKSFIHAKKGKPSGRIVNDRNRFLALAAFENFTRKMSS